MTRLDLSGAALLKRGCGQRWEFLAAVKVGPNRHLRVMFPIEQRRGMNKGGFANMMKRAVGQLRSVVVDGAPMPGYWSVYQI
jgi:hypothetical protein